MILRRPAAAIRAVLLALVFLAVTALPAAAHAELVSSDPADKTEVDGPFFGPVVLTFSEALAPGSKAVMKGPASAVYGSNIDGDKLVIGFEGALELGQYTIQWTSVAADGDILRGTVTFTVVEAPPTPTPAPTITPPSTTIPTASQMPTPSPTPSGGGTPAATTADILFPLLAALIAVGALSVFLLRGRRSAGR